MILIVNNITLIQEIIISTPKEFFSVQVTYEEIPVYADTKSANMGRCGSDKKPTMGIMGIMIKLEFLGMSWIRNKIRLLQFTGSLNFKCSTIYFILSKDNNNSIPVLEILQPRDHVRKYHRHQYNTNTS